MAIGAVNKFYHLISAAANLGCNDDAFKQEMIEYIGENQVTISNVLECNILDIVKRQMVKEGKTIV
jgi:hypothetical protein